MKLYHFTDKKLYTDVISKEGLCSQKFSDFYKRFYPDIENGIFFSERHYYTKQDYEDFVHDKEESILGEIRKMSPSGEAVVLEIDLDDVLIACGEIRRLSEGEIIASPWKRTDFHGNTIKKCCIPPEKLEIVEEFRTYI